MFYRLIIILLLAFTSQVVFAQDQLFKKDNSKQDVKILEITPTEVKYKLINNLDGPLYIILKSEVALIIYKNGEHEVFKETAPVAQQQTIYITQTPRQYNDSMRHKLNRTKNERFKEVTKTNNALFYNSAELLNSGLGFSYFRELFDNMIDIHVPCSFSLGQPFSYDIFGPTNPYGVNNYKITQKAIDIGLGIYVNTSGQKPITHFIGPLIRFAQFNGTFNSGEYNYSTYTYLKGEDHGFVVNQTYVMLNNGFLYRLTPHFNMMINAAFGFVARFDYVANSPKEYTTNGYNTNSISNTPAFQLGFSFGYRF